MSDKYMSQSNFCSSCVKSSFSRRLVILMLGGSAVLAQAQPTGLLYDPEPPPDSGYVRVISFAAPSKISVTVNGQVRIPALAKHQPSDYMVVPAGRHQLVMTASGKAIASLDLDVVRATSVTVALPDMGAPATPLVFTDKTSTNRLKSMLNVYHLASKNENIDVVTADGATKVFSGLAYGKSGGISVNPISVELMAVTSGTSTPLTRTSLSMAQGGAYSIFLIPSSTNKVTAVVAENKIERYTGK